MGVDSLRKTKILAFFLEAVRNKTHKELKGLASESANHHSVLCNVFELGELIQMSIAYFCFYLARYL